MNTSYIEQYYSLIENRKRNPLPLDQYSEKHHIKPKSIYPDLAKDPDNIVRLTASEHFKCHYLLVKHYEATGEKRQYHQMLLAFNRFAGFSNIQDASPEELDEMSRQFEELRQACSKRMSDLNKGRKRSSEFCRQVSIRVRQWKPSEATREKMRHSHLGKKRHPLTEETKEKIRRSVLKYYRDCGK